MDVGFQLSYLAVIGIISLYEKINNWLYFSNIVVRETWSIISVSLAAQLATFPLALFYFHQFPNYFLLSNLVIIPLSTIIIYGGIALLALSKWTFGASLLGKVVGWTVHALNWFVLWIEHLPYALTNKISISVFETFLIYTAILLLTFFFLKKQHKFLLAFAGIFCIVLIVQIVRMAETRNQRQLIIFDVSKTSAINFIEGRKSFLLADSSLVTNETSMNFNVRHYWWDKGIADEVLLKKDSTELIMQDASLLIRNNFIQFHKMKILLIADNNILNIHPGNKMKIDFLILSKNVKVKISELLTVFDVQQIIFDSSNSIYRCNKWEEDCKRSGIKYYTVPKQGAFVINV